MKRKKNKTLKILFIVIIGIILILLLISFNKPQSDSDLDTEAVKILMENGKEKDLAPYLNQDIKTLQKEIGNLSSVQDKATINYQVYRNKEETLSIDVHKDKITMISITGPCDYNIDGIYHGLNEENAKKIANYLSDDVSTDDNGTIVNITSNNIESSLSCTFNEDNRTVENVEITIR